METMCIACKERPIYIEKRRLCNRCYYRWYNDEKKGTKPPLQRKPGDNYHQKIQYLTEIDFSRNFFDHKNWIYRPVNFRFNGDVYEPDFYDGERNVFIEVAGTRQAFYANRQKYHAFIKAYPKIKFEIRMMNGKEIPLSATIEGTYPTSEKSDKS